MAKRPKKVLQVAFGGTSAGKNTGRIGVKISRDKLDLMLADELFTEQRLEATLTVIPKKDAKGQKNMLPDQFPTISGSFDVKGFSTRSDTFSCGFTYMKKSVDANAINEFAGQQGKVEIYNIADIPEDEESPADSEGAAEEADQSDEEEED